MTFVLPHKVFEQHIIVLGKTGSGKSSAGRVMVEHLLDRREPVCIVDPKGDWWGLKSSSDGKSAGYKVVIFGGDHADVPLNAHSGKAIAELAATGNRPCIVDVSALMPGELARFWIDFASTFFLLARGIRWLLIDEVHEVAPKDLQRDENIPKMLHWSNKLAGQGRGRGINLIGLSQRPQKVHNNFLDGCETLVAMRSIHTSARNAVKDWIQGAADLTVGAQVLHSLAQMKRGEAWVWSPEIEFGPKRVVFPMFATFDSFAPQNRGRRSKLRGWADVDLDEVKKKLENVVKEAEANDPAKLRAQIAQLQKQLRAAPPVPVAPKEVKVADPQAITRAVAPLRALLGEAMKIIVKVNTLGFDDAAIKPSDVEKTLEKVANEIAETSKQLLKRRSAEFDGLKREANTLLRKMKAQLDRDASATLTVRVDVANNQVSAGDNLTKGALQKDVVLDRSSSASSRPRPDATTNGDLTPYQSDLLGGLAMLEAIGRTESKRALVAAAAGKSATSSTFERHSAKLKQNGLVEYGAGTMRLTAAGRAVAPPAETTLTNAELHGKVLPLFKEYPQTLLRVLINAYPEKLTREALGAGASQQHTSSTFERYLASLKAAEVIEYPDKGHVKASDWLFVE